MQSAVLRSHVVCPSVRLSVTLVDQDDIRWKALKLIGRTISPTDSLFVATTRSTYSQGSMGKFLRRLEVWWEKVACWSTKAAISLKRVKIEEQLLWRAYRNSPTLFQTAPLPTPYGLLFPQDWGFVTLTQNFNGYYLRNG